VLSPAFSSISRHCSCNHLSLSVLAAVRTRLQYFRYSAAKLSDSCRLCFSCLLCSASSMVFSDIHGLWCLFRAGNVVLIASCMAVFSCRVFRPCLLLHLQAVPPISCSAPLCRLVWFPVGSALQCQFAVSIHSSAGFSLVLPGAYT